MASHNGTYTYDDAGRLTNVADTVSSSGLGGAYTWNADGTLASYPGPGYTRKLDYDEEGRLTKISRDNGSTITPVFEYGYGFDGGRRWRKDLNGNTWDWYPCGVACCAGELVTMRSTNGGASWNASETKLDSLFSEVSSAGIDLASIGASTTRVAIGGISSSINDYTGVTRYGNGLQNPLIAGALDENVHLSTSAVSFYQLGLQLPKQKQQLQRPSYTPTPGQLANIEKLECCMYDSLGAAGGAGLAAFIGVLAICKMACLGGPAPCSGCVLSAVGLGLVGAVVGFIISVIACYRNPYKDCPKRKPPFVVKPIPTPL